MIVVGDQSAAAEATVGQSIAEAAVEAAEDKREEGMTKKAVASEVQGVAEITM